MRGRKNGCPTSVRDWAIAILDKTVTGEERWVRICGLRRMSRSVESEVQDGSAETDLWQEPYVTKRSVVLKLQGRPVADAATGKQDEGQSLLDSYAAAAGCGGDATIRFTDPYGHAMAADYIVSGCDTELEETENSRSWELKQVGEAEMLPYVQVQGVSMTENGSAVTELTMRPGEASRKIAVVFAPENASNRRFRVQLTGRQQAAVSDVTAEGFAVTALAAGDAAIRVTTLNGQKTAELRVTVED